MNAVMELLDELMIMEKVVRNDIENLYKLNCDQRIVLLIQNHHCHLDILIAKYLKKAKEHYSVSS